MPLALRQKERKTEPTSIAEWLICDDRAQKRRAENALKAMGKESATRYLVWLAALEEEKRWKKVRLIQKSAAFFILAVVSLFAGAYIVSCFFNVNRPPAGLMICIGGIAAVLPHLTCRPSRLEQTILEWLSGESEDPIAVPLLMDAMRNAPSRTVETAAEGLIRSLPRITPEAALSLKQWRALLAYISTTPTTNTDTKRKQRLAESTLAAIHIARPSDLISEITQLRVNPPQHLKTAQIVSAANSCHNNMSQKA